MTLAARLSSWAAALAIAAKAIAAEEPTLSHHITEGHLLLSWPEAAPQWILEQADHLSPPVAWSLVAPQAAPGQELDYTAEIEDAEASRFFRLRSSDLVLPRKTGEWRLDEGTGDFSADRLGGANPLAVSNAFWSSGRIGPAALHFNGPDSTSSYASVSNQDFIALPPPGAPFSVSFWFSPTSLPSGWSGLAGNDPTGSNGWSVALCTTGPGTNLLVFSSGAPGGAVGQTVLIPGQWYLLTVTHDGRTGAIYLDGEQLVAREFIVKTHDAPIYFGGSIAGYRSFHGAIDHIRTYTYALAAERIALAGHWTFDEADGDRANELALHGDQANLSSPGAWVPGRSGSAIDLVQTEVTLLNDHQTLLPPTGKPFSLSFWLRPRTLNIGRNGVMSFGEEGANGWELTLDVEPDGLTWLRFVSTGRGGTLDLVAPLEWATDEWVKIEITHNGGVAKAYVNGRELVTAFGAIRSSRAPLRIGQVPGTFPLAASIDELVIHRRVREPVEIGPVASPMWETVFLNTTTNLILKGTSPAGKALIFSILPSPLPTKGSLQVSEVTGMVTYTAGGVKGPDVFAYAVSDGEFTSAPATVTISVVQPHWLSVSGGEAEFLDGSSPQRAWAASNPDALDAIWKTNAYYDCFFYGPGLYQTRGWKYQQRSTANTGCKHIGAGVLGTEATTLQLVGIWAAWTEELIFGPGSYAAPCDGFEVHNLVLDCNANNLPKFKQGEPVWIRVPLEYRGRVEAVTLHWNNSTILYNVIRAIGRAAEYTVSARLGGSVTFTTNCLPSANSSVDVVEIGVEADELIVELQRRAPGIDFYGLNEIHVSGPPISMPTARLPSGAESRLTTQYSILSAVDNDGSSAWVSGSEEVVKLEFPLPADSKVTELDLQWHCKTDPSYGRFGPAANYEVLVRNAASGVFEQASFVRHSRSPAGWETASFGIPGMTNAVTTDRVQLVLRSREAMVDRYGLREVRFRNGSRPVGVPVPSALNMLNFAGSRPIIRAFDGDHGTSWVSGTQGGVGAISLSGSNLKFTNLRVKGFGTKAGRECFPLYLISPRGQGGNVLVEDCVFSEPATNNTDGVTTVTLIQAPPDTLTNAVIRRCSILGLKPHFTYSQGFTALNVEDCLVVGASIGAYYEPDAQTDDIGSVLIRSNRFHNVDHGIFVLFHPGRQFDSLTCIGNEIILNGERPGNGIACCDICSGGMSGTVTNLTALNNVIRYQDWGARPKLGDQGLYYSDIRNAVFGNNLIVQGAGSELRVRHYPAGIFYSPGAPEVCDQTIFPPPPGPVSNLSLDLLPSGYRRAWFNNRDLSGGLLPVRTVQYGVDAMASEQQWVD